MQSLQFAPDNTDSIRVVHIQAEIEQEVISLRSVRNLGENWHKCRITAHFNEILIWLYMVNMLKTEYKYEGIL